MQNMMDDFDMIDDEVRLLLENEQERQSRASSARFQLNTTAGSPTHANPVVTVRLTWGRSLPQLLQQPQPVAVSYGTAASYEVIAAYFENRSQWPQQVAKLTAQPSLLLDTLEFAAGLQSLELFLLLCKLFKERFNTLQLPWPLDDISKIKKCSELIRNCFEVQANLPVAGSSSSASSSAAGSSTRTSASSNTNNNTREGSVGATPSASGGRQHGPYDHLLDYFTSGGLNARQAAGGVVDIGSLTHSVDPRMVYAQLENQATNEIDFSDFLSKLDPFRQRGWQPDAEADVCPSCGSYFAQDYRTYFTGVTATHCRCCGKRKCVKCCPYKLDKTIARLSKPGGPEEENLRTVCVDCFKQARVVQRSAFLSQVFIHAGLDMIQISMMRTVNSVWSAAAELSLNDHRHCLYHFHTMESASIPPNTKKLLRSSIRLLDGHPEQLVLLFLSLEWEPELPNSSAPSSSSSSSTTAAAADGRSGNDGTKAHTTTTAAAAVPPSAGGDPRRDPNASLHPTGGAASEAMSSNAAETKLAVDALLKTIHRMTSTRQSQPKFTHWHLLCTRSCACMPRAFFAIRLLNALRRAPLNHSLAQKARESVLHLLEQNLNEASVRAACVPLLLDMLMDHSTQPYAQHSLMHIASMDAAVGLQALVDLNCRPPDYYTMRTMREGILRCATSTGLLTSSVTPSGTVVAASIDKNHKFSVSLRMLEAIDSTLMQVVVRGGSQSSSSLQGAVPQALLAALTTEGLVVSTPPATTTAATTNAAATAPNAVPPSSVLVLRDMMHPFNRRVVLNRLLLSETRILTSQQRPVMLVFQDTAGHEHRFLWKGGECLRQDYIVCLLGPFMQHILVEKQELPSHSTLPKYRVLPLSPWSGLIEMVPDSLSVQGILTSFALANSLGATASHLGATGPTSAVGSTTSTASAVSNVSFGSSPASESPMLSYLLNLSTKPAEKIQIASNFLLSAKFFILLNYIFKIGDRHRDNVLIRNDGCIFHVDFGMILDVKTVAECITPAHVRFDADLEKCIHYFTAFLASQQQVAHPHNNNNPGHAHHTRTTSGGSAGTSPTPGSSPPPPPSVEASVTQFLNKTSEWFVLLRSYDTIFFLLLRHMVLNNVPPVDGAVGGATSGTRVRAVSTIQTAQPQVRVESTDGSSPSLSDPRSGAGGSLHGGAVEVDCWWDPVLSVHQRQTMSHTSGGHGRQMKLEVERLRLFLHEVFLRSMAESTCKAEFVRRVQHSRGREWVKDFTYGTKKRTTGILADLHARYVGYFQRDGDSGGDQKDKQS